MVMFWFWLLIGFAALVFGVLFSSLGAGLIFAPKMEFKKWPVAQLLFGSVLLAGGGLAASYAWNLQSTEGARELMAEQIANEREAHVKMLAFELLQNSWMLRLPAFTETDPEELQKPVVYPSLSNEALMSFITSGLFVGSQDASLMQAAWNLKLRLQGFENVVAPTQTRLLGILKGTGRAALRASLSESPTTKALSVAISDLAKALDKTGLFADRPMTLKVMVESEWDFERDGKHFIWHFTEPKSREEIAH